MHALKAFSKHSIFLLLFLLSALYCASNAGIFQSRLSQILIVESILFLFGIYAFAIKYNLKIIIFVGILLRLFTLFWVPSLSDDFYRYYWDSYLLSNDLNIFEFTPQVCLPYIDKNNAEIHLAFKLMNSKNYYSIYPTVIQTFSLLAYKASDESLISYSFYLKSIFLLFDIAGIYIVHLFLELLKANKYLITLFAINPLFILDITGNLHFDLIMMYFFLGSIYFIYVKQNSWLSAILMALSFHTKMISILLIPIFTNHLQLKEKITFYALLTSFIVLLFAPIISINEGLNLLGSIQLYFQTFEFNASIYFALRYLGNAIYGYNTIHFLGPLLKFVFVAILLYHLYVHQYSKLISSKLQASYSVLLAWLLLSTTVHPWYVGPLAIIGVIINRKVALLWTLLVALSYQTYATLSLEINSTLLWVEYGTLFILYIFLKIRNGIRVSW